MLVLLKAEVLVGEELPGGKIRGRLQSGIIFACTELVHHGARPLDVHHDYTEPMACGLHHRQFGYPHVD